MKTVRTLLVLPLLFFLPATGLAWGVLGHRIVGEIASGYLTPAARAAVKKILGHETLAMGSNWADFIKSDSTMRHLDPWHYVNLPAGLSDVEIKERLLSDTSINLYTRLNLLVRELKRKALPMEQKRFYLRLLVHLVGDAHQPLHAGRREDQGGNRIKVQWFNAQTNLHALWDESLVNFQQLSYTEYARAINDATPVQRAAWQKAPISQWIIESYGYAQRIYAGVSDDNPRLSYGYNYQYVGLVNSQLLKGGVRLAGLLNEIFR